MCNISPMECKGIKGPYYICCQLVLEVTHQVFARKRFIFKRSRSEENVRICRKTAEASMDWKPNAHTGQDWRSLLGTVSGLGIEPGWSTAQGKNHYETYYSKEIERQTSNLSRLQNVKK